MDNSNPVEIVKPYIGSGLCVQHEGKPFNVGTCGWLTDGKPILRPFRYLLHQVGDQRHECIFSQFILTQIIPAFEKSFPSETPRKFTIEVGHNLAEVFSYPDRVITAYINTEDKSLYINVELSETGSLKTVYTENCAEAQAGNYDKVEYSKLSPAWASSFAVTRLFIDNMIDPAGLIESGAAVDATKLPEDPYKNK